MRVKFIVSKVLGSLLLTVWCAHFIRTVCFSLRYKPRWWVTWLGSSQI